MRIRATLRGWVLLGLFSLLAMTVFSQDQRVADSLTRIYEQDLLEGVPKMGLLYELSFHENNDLVKGRQYAQELIDLATEMDDNVFLQKGYLQLGHSFRLTGNYDQALNAYFKSRQLALEAKNRSGEGSANITIADSYSAMNNHDKASEYYGQAISILRETRDSIDLGMALFNLGDELLKMQQNEQALPYFEESIVIFRHLDAKSGIAYNLGNIGRVNTQQGNYDEANKLLNQAISMLEEPRDYYGTASFLVSLSEVHAEQQDFVKAIEVAERSLDMAKEYGLREQISTANLQLSELYEQLGNQDASLHYYKDYISYRDSLRNLESVQQIANLRVDYEVSQAQAEVDLLNQQKKTQKIVVIATAIALLLICLLAIALYRRNQYVQRTNKIIEGEQKKSDKLLLNILPQETAQELKERGKVHAKKFESVTVMFTDFKGFTKSSENLSPEELVENVDYYFSIFDTIIKKYGLEKIKTMGDSYMCAGGLHFSMKYHASNMVLAAFDIIDCVEGVKKNNADNKMCFDIRIGINSGPVVAGVVGTTKFAYDIWGDTVNVASRLESNSDTGKINISENTYMLIKDIFDCDYRGILEVKNHGKMKMYYVKGVKDKSVDPKLVKT
jgi:class 3 adenylate cyclase